MKLLEIKFNNRDKFSVIISIVLLLIIWENQWAPFLAKNLTNYKSLVNKWMPRKWRLELWWPNSELFLEAKKVLMKSQCWLDNFLSISDHGLTGNSNTSMISQQQLLQEQLNPFTTNMVICRRTRSKLWPDLTHMPFVESLFQNLLRKESIL